MNTRSVWLACSAVKGHTVIFSVESASRHIVLEELHEQRYEYRRASGGAEWVHLSFSHPPQHYDDMLWSLALAVEAAKTEGGVVVPI